MTRIVAAHATRCITPAGSMFRRLRGEIDVGAWVPLAAIVANAAALVVFTVVKAGQDWVIVAVAVGGIAAIFAFEALYLRARGSVDHDHAAEQQ